MFYDVNQTLPIFKRGPLAKPNEGMPGRIRIGDIDANGFPDILLSVQMEGSRNVKSLILLNKDIQEQTPQLIQLRKVTATQVSMNNYTEGG
jgi:hypothetical protein